MLEVDDSDQASGDEGASEAEAGTEAAPEAAKGGGNLAGNLVSAIRSFLPMGASKGEAAPAAGKKPVKVEHLHDFRRVKGCQMPGGTAVVPLDL